MVVRGWSTAVATAIGVAAATGAAQLGLGYGLGVLRWTSEVDGVSSEAWVAGLTWAAWIAASSTIAGAVIASRLAPAEAGLLWRLVLATGATLGASTTLVLVAVPARNVEVASTGSPQTVAAGYAVVGVLAGLAVAIGALAARAVAANLLATAGWLWLLAMIGVVEAVVSGRESARVPLGFWEFGSGDAWFRNVLLPDAGIAVGAAVVIGALAALPAARRGDHPVGVVVSGAAGPLVLATVYLAAQPDLLGTDPTELSRHLIAPYLVAAGLLGSLLATAIRPRTVDVPVQAPEWSVRRRTPAASTTTGP
jgi:hypothetical protein